MVPVVLGVRESRTRVRRFEAFCRSRQEEVIRPYVIGQLMGHTDIQSGLVNNCARLIGHANGAREQYAIYEYTTEIIITSENMYQK